jgi:Large polyvalent protein associated domain 29
MHEGGFNVGIVEVITNEAITSREKGISSMTILRRNHAEHRYEAMLKDGRRIAVAEDEIQQSLLYASKEGMDEDKALKDILTAENWVQYVGAPGRLVSFVPSVKRQNEMLTVKHQQAEIAATIAENIRRAVKEAFPGIRFRVVHRGYADGEAYVSISWPKAGPEESVVQEVCRQFETGTSRVFYDRRRS